MNSDSLNQHISKLILEGYTEGFHPRWKLKADPKLLEDSVNVEVISNLIKEGYNPRWVLEEVEPADDED